MCLLRDWNEVRVPSHGLASRIVCRRANPSRGQFGSKARLVLQTEELDLLALLVYLLSSEVDKARAETERAVEVRVAIMFVSQLSELLRFFYR